MKCEKCNKEYDESLSSCPYCVENETEKLETKQNSNLNNPDNLSDLPNSNEKLPQEYIPQEQKTVNIPVETSKIQQPQEAQHIPGQANDQISAIRNNLFCKYCGGTINRNGNYCMTCGRSSVDENIRHCPKCGLIIPSDTTFCPRCGNKITYSKNAAKLKYSLDKSKKTIITVIIVILAAALVLGAGFTVVPQIFASPYKIMAKADYEKAYKRAKKDQKDEVLFENIVAVCCSDIKSDLKDPDSFVLREVWIDAEKGGGHSIVLRIGGKNSYGGMTSSYYLYRYNSDSNCYTYYNNISDFDEEEYNYYDDYKERAEKLIDNFSKALVKSIITDSSNEITNGIVDRINDLNQNGKLNDVKLIDEVKEVYPNKSSSNSDL
ncbi:MAG: zinc ribbon domain-containing protein [Clostridia bacterium]|nr:zinc ribbon domain-containing protein [Clostridia bacterium]